MTDLSPDCVRFLKYLTYDDPTGLLYWKKREGKSSWNSRWEGKLALNCVNNTGYKVGAIEGKNYLAHRVIWCMKTGGFPIFIDHINGIKTDNRWVNLREVSFKDNCRNLPVRVDNKTGMMGVHYRKESGKWFARIKFEGEIINLGTFDTFQEACEARQKGEIRYGYHKNHNRFKP